MKKSYLLILLLSLLSCLTLSAKEDRDEWQPVAAWPFIYKDFQYAMITTASGQQVRGQADIHVGMHYLWYDNKDKKKVAAKEGTITRVLFKNGDVFMPVENKLCKVIREDTIHGQLCRIYRSDEVDKVRFDELSRINNMGSMDFDMGIVGINDLYAKVAEHEGSNFIDQNPLPMNTVFYMLYDGETFLVNETNILKHLTDKKERNAYRAFTRSAEIIYSNESSVLNIWTTFLNK